MNIISSIKKSFKEKIDFTKKFFTDPSPKPLAFDQRIFWNSSVRKQIEEAKVMFRKWNDSGYTIVDKDGKKLERFHPDLEQFTVKAGQPTAKHSMQILNETGDEIITWDSENGRQALEAKEKFLEYLDKGYKAYSDRNGKRGIEITEFDVDAEKIRMIPPTAKG